MPRGNNPVRIWKREPAGRLFALAGGRPCPACGLHHRAIPPACRREIERKFATSLSDRHRHRRPSKEG